MPHNPLSILLLAGTGSSPRLLCHKLCSRSFIGHNQALILSSQSRALSTSHKLWQDAIEPQSQSSSPLTEPTHQDIDSSSSYINGALLIDHIDKPGTPRWQKTPDALLAPVSTNKRSSKKPFMVNTDPRTLDRAYQSFLGPFHEEGSLSEEVRWQAVTHKTFDQGRRGFNDRLSYLGKRIVNLQTSIAMINLPATSDNLNELDQYGRAPFVHPALDGLDVLTAERRTDILDKINLSKLARQHGLQKIVRWEPRYPENTLISGESTVVAQSVYAIIGAIALEKGGLVATKIARERILRPLGL